jgi:hypothetical protein
MGKPPRASPPPATDAGESLPYPGTVLSVSLPAGQKNLANWLSRVFTRRLRVCGALFVGVLVRRGPLDSEQEVPEVR